MNVAIGTTEDRALYEDALRVRRIVFIEEQNVPEEEEIDAFEHESFHLVLYDGEQAVAAGRFRRSMKGLAKRSASAFCRLTAAAASAGW